MYNDSPISHSSSELKENSSDRDDESIDSNHCYNLRGGKKPRSYFTNKQKATDKPEDHILLTGGVSPIPDHIWDDEEVAQLESEIPVTLFSNSQPPLQPSAPSLTSDTAGQNLLVSEANKFNQSLPHVPICQPSGVVVTMEAKHPKDCPPFDIRSTFEDLGENGTKSISTEYQPVSSIYPHVTIINKKGELPAGKPTEGPQVGFKPVQVRHSTAEPPKSPIPVQQPINPRIVSHAVTVTRQTVSDSLIGPRPFQGISQNGEDWINYFEKYCQYKDFTDEDRLRLMKLLLVEQASDWVNSLQPEQLQSYATLQAAFRERYFRSPQLRWKDESTLFNSPQLDTESVDNYVARLQKIARRAGSNETTLHHAVINGLKGPIKMAVCQQGLGSLQDTLRAARIAEISVGGDPISSALVEQVKLLTSHCDKQNEHIVSLVTSQNSPSDEIKGLATQVATLTQMMQSTMQASNDLATASLNQTNFNRNKPNTDRRSFYDSQRDSRLTGFRGRKLKPTAQNQQRIRYGQELARNFEQSQNASNFGFQQPLNSPSGQLAEQFNNECRSCGYPHAPRNCPAFGKRCMNCDKMGHFARVCRAAKFTRE